MSNNLYTIDEKSHLRFNIDALDKNQCTVAHDTCTAEASSQRYKVIADIIGSVVVAGVAVITALAVANFTAAHFLALIAKTETLSGFVFHQVVYDVATLAYYGMIYTCGLIGLKAIWDNATAKVQNHFAYAAMLDQQALTINLHKASLDNLANA